MPEIIPNWHPIFVHFTVALLSLSVILFAIKPLLQGRLQAQLLIVARWTLWIGVAITLLTGLAGLEAYNSVTHDSPSHAAMTEHRNWALSVIVLFPLLALWLAYRLRKGKEAGRWFISLMLAGGLLLLSTAWHGGELVYRYGLGVMSLPKPEGDGHNHSHAGQRLESATHGHEEMRGTPMEEGGMDFSGMEKGLEQDHDDGTSHAHDGDAKHTH